MHLLLIATATLLISFDGLRPDQISAETTPHLDRFRQEGVFARMTPVFPSSTFPNHATLATGCWPAEHGIVSNHFLDPVRGRFDKDGDATWLSCEPIWARAERKGKRTAVYTWPFAHTPWRGVRPTYSVSYREALGRAGWKKKKVNGQGQWRQILDWLKLPPSSRPELILGYFPAADHAGHRYGPFATGTLQALKKTDEKFGAFLEALRRENLLETTNIILVSDHGMGLGSGAIPIDDDLKRLRLILGKGAWKEARSANTVIHFYFKEKKLVPQAFSFLKKIPNVSVYSAGRFPRRFHCENPRSGDLILTANPPHFFANSRKGSKTLKGFHGYDPSYAAVHAFFSARGPAFRKRGAATQPMRAVDIAPMVAKILGVSK